MNSIKIGIAGLGNVGQEVVYQILNGLNVQKDLFHIEIIAVSAKSKNKSRKVNLENIKFFIITF